MSGDAGSSTPEQRFQGLGVSPGLARGTVFVLRPDEETAPDHAIAEKDIPAEIARFEAALLLTRAQILEMQAKIAEAIGAKDASIFDAHLLVVEDRTLIDEVLRTLERERRNIEVDLPAGRQSLLRSARADGRRLPARTRAGRARRDAPRVA